jgi:uncharacterized protein (TIGR02284 family)
VVSPRNSRASLHAMHRSGDQTSGESSETAGTSLALLGDMITSDIERQQFTTTITALNRCIEACTDGEKGYGAAAADVRDPRLKSIMRSYEQQRADFVGELQRTIDALGADHENQGTLRGAIHRGFTGARLSLEGRNDEVVLEECVRGEGGALNTYDAALELAAGMPDHVRALLVQQRSCVAAALGDILNQLTLGDGKGPTPPQRTS